MANLMDGLLKQLNRCRDLVKIYDDLPGGVGVFGSAMIKQRIKQGEDSIASGDVVKMAVAYQELQGCE